MFADEGGTPRGLFRIGIWITSSSESASPTRSRTREVARRVSSAIGISPSAGHWAVLPCIPSDRSAHRLGSSCRRTTSRTTWAGRVGVPELGADTFSNPFPDGVTPAPGASAGPLTRARSGVEPPEPDPEGSLHCIDIQPEHSTGTDAQTSPGHGLCGQSVLVNLPWARASNEISAADLAEGAAFRQQTVTRPLCRPGSLDPASTEATVQRQQLLRPFPQFGGITANALFDRPQSVQLLPDAGGEVILQGTELPQSYTVSKCMEQNNLLNSQDTNHGPTVTRLRLGPTGGSRAGSMTCPSARGGSSAAMRAGIVNHFISGWQINAIFTVQSWTPLIQPDLERLGSAKLDNRLSSATSTPAIATSTEIRSGAVRRNSGSGSSAPHRRCALTLNRFSDIACRGGRTMDASLFKNIKISQRFHCSTPLRDLQHLWHGHLFEPLNTGFASANFARIPEPGNAIDFRAVSRWR